MKTTNIAAIGLCGVALVLIANSGNPNQNNTQKDALAGGPVGSRPPGHNLHKAQPGSPRHLKQARHSRLCKGCDHSRDEIEPARKSRVGGDPVAGALGADGRTTGSLPRLGDLSNGENSLIVRAHRFTDLRSREVGDRVSIPLANGVALEGTINMAKQDPATGWIRSAALDGHPDAVLIVSREPKGDLDAMVFSRSEDSAYLLSSLDEGNAVMKEVARTDIVPDCGLHELPDIEPGPAPDFHIDTVPLFVWLYQSKPGADKVLYLDFDGEEVDGTWWNSSFNDGDPIKAASSGLESDEIVEVWKDVSEDFRPFNVNVTTNRSVYNAADPSDRQMIVVTSSWEWYGAAGGVAYVGHFGNSSAGPAWAFSTWLGSDTHNYAMAISHEFGHTLSLSHDTDTDDVDGDGNEEYYPGHGSGYTSWGPLMGAPYWKSLTQWNDGTYPGADNTEDDTSLIDGWLGRRPDDFADSPSSAVTINRTSDVSVSQAGIIETSEDVDVFKLGMVSGGAGVIDAVNLTVTPFGSENYLNRGANLDIQARLLDSTGAELASSNPEDDIDASITYSFFGPAKTLYLEVSGVGKEGDDGYSDYGSLGYYKIEGSVLAIPFGEPVGFVVVGNDQEINDGDTSSSTANGTDFGSLRIGDDPVITRFSMRNDGDEVLVVSDINVSTDSFDSQIPVPFYIMPGNEAPLDIRFDPQSEGPVEATVSIQHSGQDDQPFQFTVSGWGTGAPDDAYGPNGSVDAAYDLSALENTWLSQIEGLGVQTAADFFRIHVTPGQELVRVEARFSHEEGDIDLALVDPEGLVIASSETTGDDESIEVEVPAPGEYYIVLHYGNAGNSYDLRWADEAVGETVDDHGNDVANGTPVIAVERVSGSLDPGDVDVFVFEIAEPTLVRAQTLGDTDTVVTLGTEIGTVLATNDDGGTGANGFIEMRLRTAGRYSIEVRGQSPATLGTYELAFNTATLSRLGVTNLRHDTGSGTTLDVLTEPGRSYTLQRSMSLRFWDTVATGITEANATNLLDAATAGGRRAFYRVILE